MVVIRADGNGIIGTGHIMRCLSIADALRRKNSDVLFIVADNNATELIKRKKYPVAVLDSDYANMETELEPLKRVLRDTKPNAILVDSYYVEQNYLAEISDFAPVYYIDDLCRFPYKVDGLIAYNIYANKEQYNELYLENNIPKLYIGPKFAPLRNEFKNRTKNIRHDVEKVLFLAGGSDPEHISLQFAKYISEKDDSIKYEFVLGSLNNDAYKINELSSCNISVKQNVENMAELMLNCDIAISAAGSTLYELCACGIPTITYALADNQLVASSYFRKIGLMQSVGDCRSNPTFMDNMYDGLLDLVGDSEKRAKVSKKMQSIVDGLGSERIADVLISSRNMHLD